MTTESERKAKADAAGRMAGRGTSPYAKEAQFSVGAKLLMTGVYVFDVAVGVWMHGHHAPWWMQATYWVTIAGGFLLTVAFAPLARKIKRRKMLLAREQVHQVRKLLDADLATLGFGLLFDSDPTLDQSSTEAGAWFALSAIRAALDEVEARTSKIKFLGVEIPDDGKKAKR